MMIPADEPGFAVLAFSSGGKMEPVCSGLADLQQRTPITPLTNFRMASVSKQFTAMTILQLGEQKKLATDDPLKRFFEKCPENYRDITVKQLLCHTSGIWDYEALVSAERKTQVLDEDVWELVSRHGELYFKPGRQFRYSNTGYCLLALIAARVSGTGFPALMKTLIFDPLAMSSSLVYEPGCAIPHRALGYIPGNSPNSGNNVRTTDSAIADSQPGKSMPTAGNDPSADRSGGFILNDQSITSATKGDGGVYTSLADYVKWDQALYTEKLVSVPLPEAAFSSKTPVANGIDYGYGWFSGKETDGSRCVFHSGETSGFLNMVYRNPSKKLLIAIFSNRNDGSISQKFEETARRMNVTVRLDGYAPGNQPPLFNWLSQQYS